MTIMTLICVLTGTTLFAYWFNYVIGKPLEDQASHIDVGAIGHWLPHELAIRRLKRVDRKNCSTVFEPMMTRHVEEMNLTPAPETRADLHRDFKRDVMTTARKFFTWERSVLCPVCLHWWLTVLVLGALLIFSNLLLAQLPLAGLVYLVNHFIIRKI